MKKERKITAGTDSARGTGHVQGRLARLSLRTCARARSGFTHLRLTLGLAVVVSGLLASTNLVADAELDEYEFANADVLLRIAAANHKSGVYKSAKTLASLFNWQQMPDVMASGGQQRAIPISTSSTEASVRDLIQGRAELAIVRADLADSIYRDVSRNEANDSDKLSGSNLRLVSTHEPEFLHLIVRSDFEGATTKSLDGKRVNVGGAFSGDDDTILRLLAESGSNVSKMEIFYAPVVDALRRLDEGQLDAVVFFDQAPSALVADKLLDLDYRMLQYSANSESAAGSTKTTPSYFVQASSAEFYQTPETTTSLIASTYLLTRIDVAQESVEPVFHLLGVKPAIDEESQDYKAADSEADDSTEVKSAELMDIWHQPFSISESLSPIPLHPSSQLMLDIFSDRQVSVSIPDTRAIAAARIRRPAR